ncbi:MAG: beta-glucuronidase [Bacteroidales bacterium]|nr:beta-glucuronidase [Bacteroidales bacterium]
MNKNSAFIILFSLLIQIGAFGQEIPRPEYPRPQFERTEWLNLNGEWSYSFDFGNSGVEQDFPNSNGFANTILVPFCPESKLSGVQFTDFINHIWYHRSIQIPIDWEGKSIILNFGAVDYICEVFIDGNIAGRHYGGTSSFSFDISAFVTPGKSHELVVHAEDNTRSGEQPLGKQSREFQPKRTRYTRTTGIWQTVWMEAIHKNGLISCQIIPDLDDKKFDFIPRFYRISGEHSFRISLYENGLPLKSKLFDPRDGKICSIYLDEVKLWAPENPFLYEIHLEVLDNFGKVIDHVKSYSGMRKVHIEGNRVFLNNQAFYQRLVLDQGFYPDGIWTAPSDEALKKDIELSMAAGFNGARLHQKVFEERFHYWADKLGYITWGESSSWGMDANNPVAARNFISEWTEIVGRDRNHPSIIIWTPFNESIFTLDESIRYKPELRKQHDRLVADVYDITKRIDPSRPINDVSGYLHIKTDIWSGHCYEQDPEKLRQLLESDVEGKPYTGHREFCCSYDGEPYILDEFGGIKWNPSQQDNSQKSWGYGSPPASLEEYYKRLQAHVDIVLSLEDCSGYCYTQLTDVESEQNGIYFYDRSLKFNMEKIHAIFSKYPRQYNPDNK